MTAGHHSKKNDEKRMLILFIWVSLMQPCTLNHPDVLNMTYVAHNKHQDIYLLTTNDLYRPLG